VDRFTYDTPPCHQRQCDEFGPVLTIRSSDIDGAVAARVPVTIDDQLQATRVAIDLGVVHRRPTGAGEIYWCVEFGPKAFQGLAKTSGKAYLVRRRTGQFRV